MNIEPEKTFEGMLIALGHCLCDLASYNNVEDEED
jgi:hypothetical protein